MLWLCLTLQIKLGGGLAPLLPGSDAYAMHWSLIVIVQLEDYNFKTAFLKFPFFKTTGMHRITISFRHDKIGYTYKKKSGRRCDSQVIFSKGISYSGFVFVSGVYCDFYTGLK